MFSVVAMQQRTPQETELFNALLERMNRENAGFNNSQSHRKWMDRLTVFTLITAVIAAAFTGFQGLEARNTYIASDRPWVDYYPKLTGPLVSNGMAATLSIEVTSQNVGHSPAQNIQADVRLVSSKDIIDIKKYSEDFCKRLDNLGLQLNDVIFPDAPNLNKEVTLHSDINDADRKNGSLLLFLIGCVSYRSVDDNQRHHTNFIRMVRQNGHPEGVSLKDLPLSVGEFGLFDNGSSVTAD